MEGRNRGMKNPPPALPLSPSPSHDKLHKETVKKIIKNKIPMRCLSEMLLMRVTEPCGTLKLMVYKSVGI